MRGSAPTAARQRGGKRDGTPSVRADETPAACAATTHATGQLAGRWRCRCLRHVQCAVVVAVIVVWVMQAPIDEVVGVIAVRDWIVPTILTVNMAVAMHLRRIAVAVRIGVVDSDDMLVDVVVVWVMKVPVVQVVRVPVVHDSGVPAPGPVNVVMPVMDVVIRLVHARDGRPRAAPRQAVSNLAAAGTG
ncbi:MAG: hypothetical protein QOJ85_4234 [Solirubrobacteraceae bacterium]|jgi:hypothetical protein|nr:hypothetical protein [Solirubrobacteraceae bacterium]MEA2243760.1 hypothetical protein [Solirubrobacteraceae bacterium]